MTSLQHKQKMDRWAYYGKLGSLRMAEQVLRSINTTYGQADIALNIQIAEALNAITNIRTLLVAHKDDWRIQPQSTPNNTP